MAAKQSSSESGSSTSTSSNSSRSTCVNMPKLKKVKKTKRNILTKFLTSEADEHHTMKMVLGFPFGGLLGYALYCLVILPMQLPEETRLLLCGLLMFTLSAGYSLSSKFRCVCLLLLPTFMGKAGRSYIGTFAIAFLIAGPIENIVNNAQDITRSLTCAAQLSANHTASKWKFRLQPVGNVMKDMAEEGWMLNRLGKKVNEAFVPIKSEIRGDKTVAEMEERTKEEDKLEGGIIDRSANIEDESKTGQNDDDAKKVENKYKKKIKFECEDIYNKGVQECRNVFNRLERRCKDNIPSPLDGFLCVLVNVGFLCRLVEPLGKALGGECKPSDVVRPSFGKMFKKTEESMGNMDDGFEVKMQYKVVKGKDDVDYTSVEEMRSNTMHGFTQGRKLVEFVMLLVKRLLGFTFLLVIISAYKYFKKYTTDVRFDNMYITSYFRKIDARRKFKGKKVLLPLRKLEADKCIFPTSLKLMNTERRKLGKGTVFIMARAILAGMVFVVADILYNVLNIIRQNSRVDYRQSGTNTIDVKIGGTGFMSNIVRLFMNGLNTKSKLDQVSSNFECLPRPEQVDTNYYYYVFGIYLLVWSLTLLDAYALRCRKVIAAFFFRKREKQRTLYLYNTMMQKRKYFLRDMRRKVKRKAKKLQLKARSGLLYSLARQCPFLCSCLKRMDAGRDRCLVCEAKETKLSFEKCDTCKFVYCQECWHDIKKTCYSCLRVEELSTTDSDSITDDDENEDM